MSQPKQLVFVTDTSNPESSSMEFHSLCEDEEDSILPPPTPTARFSQEDFFPAFPPDMISGHSFVQNHHHRFQSISSLRGRVYCAGGSGNSYSGPSKTVYCWDARRRDWTHAPPTNVARAECTLHALRGDLYVHDGGSFMEVLDRDAGQWVNLPTFDVNLNPNNFRLAAAVESKGFFLFGSDASDHFYAYAPPDKWDPMPHLPFDSVMMGLPMYSPVVTEDYLLWLHSCHRPGVVIGFDHNKGIYFKIDLASEGIYPKYPKYSRFDYPFLAYAGDGILALAWIDPDHFETATLCHCVKFSLSLGEDENPRVKLVSRQSRVGPPLLRVCKSCIMFFTCTSNV